MAECVRRLPVYLLLDISGSMSGEPIEAVRQGVKMMLSELKSNPYALETVYLSAITFNGSAQQVFPLTELKLCKEPELTASGGTSMGEALNVLMDCIKSEVRQDTADRKGDYNPLVFLMTDGEPTDICVFDDAVSRLPGGAKKTIVAFAAGGGANTERLKQITPNVLMMKSLLTDGLVQFFSWCSGTILSFPRIGCAMHDEDVDEDAWIPPAPPPGFVIVP